MTKKSDKTKARGETHFPQPIENLVRGMGGRFQMIRKRLGLTQPDMLDMLGLSDKSVSTLSYWERNDVSRLDLDLFFRAIMLVEQEGYQVKWFLLGLGPMLQTDVHNHSMTAVGAADILGIPLETMLRILGAPFRKASEAAGEALADLGVMDERVFELLMELRRREAGGTRKIFFTPAEAEALIEREVQRRVAEQGGEEQKDDK